VAGTSVATEERRLHPLSWLFAAAQVAKGFIVPALVVLFASGESYELWALAFVVPVAVGAIVQYSVFRYRLAADEIVVRDGLLTRTERHIPYARIQNVDLVQNPLHRLLGVALVRVETASGSRPEAVMRVLSLGAVDEMRAAVVAGRGSPAAMRPRGDAPADAGTGLLLHVGVGELVKLGTISNRGLVVVGAVAGLWWQRASFGPDLGDWAAPLIESALARLPGLAAGPPLVRAVLAGTVLLLAAVALLRLFSIGWYVLQLYDFTLRRRGPDLAAAYGLLTRVSRTIPTSRVQSLRATETPLHRWFGRQSVELRTAGGGAGSDTGADLDGAGGGASAEKQWLAPLVETGRVPALIEAVLPDAGLDRVRWETLPHRAWRRVFVRSVAVAVLPPTLAAALVLSPWMLLLAVPGGLAAAAHARLTVRHTAYALAPWGVLSRLGWWNRTLTLVRYARIQTVALCESPFDRRHRTASVRIDTAGAAAGRYTIRIPYLDRETAAIVSRRLHDEAAHRSFRW